MSHKRKHSTADRNATSAFDVADELQPRRAFSVSGVPDYTDDAPQTAEEYLRRVKWEARHQPRVFTSTIDPRRFDHLQTKGYVSITQPLPHTSARVMPSAEWESEFAAQFADIRLSFAHYSQLHPAAAQQPRPPTSPLSAVIADDSVTAPRNIEAWARYCLGLSSTIARPPTPSLPTVAAFDHLTTRGVLAQIVSHLQQAVPRAETQRQRNNRMTTDEGEQAKGGHSNNAAATELRHNMLAERDGDEDEDEEEEEGEENISQPAISSQPSTAISDSSASRLDPLSALSASTTRWLYCLLAHLQKPLPSETEVHLRQLYRVCGTIRAEAGKRVDKSDDSRQPVESKQPEVEQQADAVRAAEETAMWCNMLLTIVDRIFGQRIPLQVIPAS